jgi:hypothetical protein
MKIKVKDIKVGTCIQKDGIIYKIERFNILPMNPPLRGIRCREVDGVRYYSW